MAHIPVATVKRIIKESGAERVSDDAAATLADAMEDYAETIAIEAIKLAKHAGRKTITDADIKLVFQ